MRSILLRSLLLAASVLSQAGCSGCGGPPSITDGQDVWSGLDVATETGSEMEGQSMTYLWARPTGVVVFCIKAPCPSYSVRGVDGSDSRLVHQFDLRALGLPRAEQDALLGRMGQLLTRGRYRNWRFMGQDVVVFQVVRALDPATPGAAEHPDGDRYYQLRIADACQDDGCLKWQGRPLNRALEVPPLWNELDLTPLGLEQLQQQALLLKLRSRGGYVSVQPTPTAIPLITQAFPSP